MQNKINPQAQVYLRSPVSTKSANCNLNTKPKSMTQSVALQDITNNHANNISLNQKMFKENVKPINKYLSKQEQEIVKPMIKQQQATIPINQQQEITMTMPINQQQEIAMAMAMNKKQQEMTKSISSQQESNQQVEEEKKSIYINEETISVPKSEKQSIQQSQQEEEIVELQSYTNEELQRMQEANWLIFDQICYSKQFFDDIFRNILTNFASKMAFLQQKSTQLISTNKETDVLTTREFLSMETSGLFQQLMMCDETQQHLYELMYHETRNYHQQCLIINSMEEIYSIDPRNLNQFNNIIIDINEPLKEETKQQGNKIFTDFGRFLGYCEHATSLQLILRNLNITDQQFALILSQLHQLKFMESFALDICKNKISNSGMITFSSKLEELVQLSQLTIIFDFNQIASEGACALGNAFMKLNSITTLNLQLGNNDITSKGAIQLFKGIKKLPQLIELKLGLRNNILSDKMFEGFTHQIHNLFYLQKVEIDLYNNSLTKVGFEALNSALLSGNYLFYLKIDIGRNEIEKIASFLKFLKYGNKLLGLKLYLDTNALKSSQLKEIIKYLQFQTELTELKIDCSGYLLTTAFYKELALVGEKLNKLEKFELSLNSCKISPEKVDLIINGLSKFKGLKMIALSLSDNGLRMSTENLKKNIKDCNESIEMIECFL